MPNAKMNPHPGIQNELLRHANLGRGIFQQDNNNKKKFPTTFVDAFPVRNFQTSTHFTSKFIIKLKMYSKQLTMFSCQEALS